MSASRASLIPSGLIALLLLTGCVEHSPCAAHTSRQTSPDGGGRVEVRYWVCKRGMWSRERYTSVDVGISKWGGLSDRVFRIENRHEVTARWDGPHRVTLVCHDVNGDRITQKLDSLTLTSLQCDPSKAAGVGRDGMTEVSETISISYDLQ